MAELLEELINMCREFDFDLARAAFIASGVRDRNELASYLQRFDDLCSNISRGEKCITSASREDRAQAIVDYLWGSQQNRAEEASYGDIGIWRLTEVFDNQLSGKDVVGNCFGLTLLYNCIAERLGLITRAVVGENHTYSIVEGEEGWRVVENTINEKLGCRQLTGNIISNQKFIKKLLCRMVIAYERDKKYKDAFAYEKTLLMINPHTELPYSLFNLSERIGDIDLAIKQYDEILNQHPEAYNVMRSLALALEQRNKRGDICRAMNLYERASSINPDRHYDECLRALRMFHPILTVCNILMR